MVVLNPKSIVTGPSRTPRWGRTLSIDLGTLDSTLAISRDNRLPRAAVVVTLAAQELMRLSKGGEKVDNILVVGTDVDPTRHPGFREVTDNLRALRNKWFARAKLNLISNDPCLDNPEARITLGIYDFPVVRLEAGTAKTFQKLTGHKSTEFGEIVKYLSTLERVIVQTCFVRGDTDNSTDSEIKGWLKRLKEIEPIEILLSSPPSRKRKDLPLGIPPSRIKEIVEMVTEEIGAKVTEVEYKD